jgi:cbb3-type cytochrome oxidase maturation protein
MAAHPSRGARMFANSVAVILLVLLIGLPTLMLLIWSLRTGQFENLHVSSESIFDEEELRYVRPWENRKQAQERVSRFGKPLEIREGWIKWL